MATLILNLLKTKGTTSEESIYELRDGTSYNHLGTSLNDNSIASNLELRKLCSG